MKVPVSATNGSSAPVPVGEDARQTEAIIVMFCGKKEVIGDTAERMIECGVFRSLTEERLDSCHID